MADLLSLQKTIAQTSLCTDSVFTDSYCGHFFRLDHFREGDAEDATSVGGRLYFGTDSMVLNSDHADQLADRLRTAIDNSIAGSVIYRSPNANPDC